MKTSRILAKVMVRLVFILLLIAGFALVQGSGKLHQLGYINLYQWQLIFPVLLILGFIALLILASVKKFMQPDINWLLVINSVMLVIYGMAIFFKISSSIH